MLETILAVWIYILGGASEAPATNVNNDAQSKTTFVNGGGGCPGGICKKKDL